MQVKSCKRSTSKTSLVVLAEQLPVDRLSFYTLIQGICSSGTPTTFALFVDFLAWPLSHALAMRARTKLKTKTKTTTLPSNNNSKKQQQQLRKYKHAAQLKKNEKIFSISRQVFIVVAVVVVFPFPSRAASKIFAQQFLL